MDEVALPYPSKEGLIAALTAANKRPRRNASLEKLKLAYSKEHLCCVDVG
jgi:hypothetical protein